MRKETRTGLATMLVLVLFGAFSIFVTGRWRPFARQTAFETSFQNVEGLKEGAWVRSQGMKIGTVTWIGRSSDPADARVHVRLLLLQQEASRIREDAVVRMSSRGLLGDKLLVIDPGHGPARSRDNTWMPSVENPTAQESLNAMRGARAKADALSTTVEKLADTANDSEFQSDLASALRSWDKIRRDAECGNGFVRRLSTDSELRLSWSGAIHSLDAATADAAQASSSLQEIAARVREGPGAIHQLAYEDKGQDASRAMRDAASEIQIIAERGTPGRGFLSSTADLESSWEAATTAVHDARILLSGIEQGKGTLGGLWTDTSLRDDLGSSSTNVERNRVFRALVRYSVKRDEARDLRVPAPRR